MQLIKKANKILRQRFLEDKAAIMGVRHYSLS